MRLIGIAEPLGIAARADQRGGCGGIAGTTEEPSAEVQRAKLVFVGAGFPAVAHRDEGNRIGAGGLQRPRGGRRQA